MYFSKLNILWKEIDRRMPNPMKCSEDITLFNSFIQRQRLYQFLAGIDNSLDKEKRDLLYLDPLPTLDAAYATIRREIARRGIMTGDSSSGQSPSEIGSGLVAQNRSEKSSRLEDKTMLKCSHCGGTKHTKSGCFKLIGYPEWWDELRQRKAAAKATGNRTGGKANFVASEREIDGDDGSSPTTKNTPGKSTGTGINLIANFHGEAMKEKGKVTEEDERFGKVSGKETIYEEAKESEGFSKNFHQKPMAHTIKQPTLSTPINSHQKHTTHIETQQRNSFYSDKNSENSFIQSGNMGLLCKSMGWILDCGATDTMSYDPSDFISFHPTKRTQIQTANGELIPIDRAGKVDVSPNIHLNDCLLIPSLSHKLLSVSQLTKELDCTVLLTSSGCMVQEAQTGRIIGSGTERGGLYFLDEATQHGNALLAHGSPEYQLWMWHRRLGHPSVGYLKRLFPSFKNIDVTLDCESCALAKSHKHTYSPSLTHAIKPFMLIHSDVWGPAPEFAIHNFSYFVLFVDD
uniref:GAG-pre-integrase domain-containing protein n=1 Tax=Chenopodium quinoa TaxID=63459 RepID=A0A803N1T0_CHEQI